MMPVFRVNRDLGRRAKRYLIIAHVIGNIDDSHRTTRPPRLVLIRSAPFFRLAIVLALTTCLVCEVSGTWREMTSASA
jgi:hypothetical protein